MVPLRFCHAVLPYMIKQQYGKVVNISSAVGRQAVPLAVAYSAAKAGVIAITRSLAVAMATYNIRVNCVCPGSIETPLSIRILSEHPEHVKNLLKQSLLKRTGHPKEVAPVVLFLASEEASYMLGQSLSVDGGRVML
jgi:NAD(P)-dependent dehydrogenase (short-subunit alcohol dehydrogenase family)